MDETMKLSSGFRKNEIRMRWGILLEEGRGKY
jgi:hypothetical protein